MGDKMFDNSSVTPLPGGWEHNMFQATVAFWNCAEQIEEWAGRGYSNVLWYLVSDSQDLRCLCDKLSLRQWPDRPTTAFRLLCVR